MEQHRFYRCKKCGNLVGLIVEGGGTLVCCGEPMEELVPNSSGAAKEKHLPVVTKNGDTLHVSVGEVIHPMSAEHSIQWIYLQTKKGGCRKALSPDKAPEADFVLADGDEPVAVYAWCNLHGLWATEL